ncbi:MAG: DNA repair protein RecN [Candidatus Limnocylindrales bacterium]
MSGDGAAATGPGRLLELTVTDLALIDRLRLAFDAGFNVITGETGAGKSLLIDALGLALGTRADTTLVRHGAETARVEALFDRLPEPLIAVREVAANGRSTARLDDTTVTAARLADEIGSLVEVHGQHDQGRLLDERWQRDLLDGYGGHEGLRAAMATAVERWRENRAALDAAALDPREVERRLDLLEHEAADIAAAGLRAGEADEIRGRLTAAQHGEAIARGAVTLREALTQEGAGARDTAAVALHEARGLARLDPRFEPLADRLAGLEAELTDVADEARRLAESVDHDPRAVEELDARLGVIHGLIRRYGDDEAAVIAYGHRASREAERLRGLDEERARRQREDAEHLAEVAAAGGELSSARHETGIEIARAVAAVLEELGFPAGVFEVAVGRRSAGPGEAAVEVDGDAVAFDAAGIDQVVFRLAPNAGEPARPLAKIASGGELSRVALAIKRVLAEADATPTLVFDEVDTGIGGRSADPIGRSLWGLARRHQVLCVTHLPQIAAHADAHYRIAKRERDGRTVTEVERLDREGRIVELAAMLGGGPGDQASLASARELLDRAETWRSGPVEAGRAGRADRGP